MDIDTLIQKLTIEEKIALVSGTDFMYTNPVPRLGIPSVRMSDGPHGLRVQKEGGDNGVTGSEMATAFPTAATTASSWNPSNTYQMGEAMGEEALHYGIDVILGPGACIKRNPLCGRNFEYFSEDPLLSASMASAEVKGIQSKNVGASVKHFALNNAENYRFMGDSICDERAMREIYLKSFERIVKESKPHTVMCAYNKINGEYCCQNKWLLTDTLRDEWGFDGLVMSDWGATHDRVKGVASGLDLEMPGDTAICRKWLMDAIQNKTLKEEDLDKGVKNVLRLVNRYEGNEKGKEVDWKKHNELALEIALDSAVLLKNENVLPLKEEDKLFVTGDLFTKMRYQGSGSSMINPSFLSTPKSAFDEQKVNYKFARGYAENKIEPDEKLIQEAVAQAKDFDTILIFAGLTDYVESEGCDRESMKLPANQLALIHALAGLGEKIVVVLYGGSSIEVPFESEVDAILDMYLPGQNGGNATYKLLFGEVSPSGKLAETWPLAYEDVPFGKDFSKNENEVYKESVFVGYRYYVSANKKVRYPFGYGLSYSRFSYDDLTLKEDTDSFTVTVTVTNTGDFDASEVVELYVEAPKGIYKPKRELKGFSKVHLRKNETKRVEILVKKEDLRYFDIQEKRWITEGGDYLFEICQDAATVLLKESVHLEGDNKSLPYSNRINDLYSSLLLEKVSDEVFEEMSGLKIPPLPVSMPLDIESRFSKLQNSKLFGRIIYKAVLSVAHNDYRKAKRMPEGPRKENTYKGALFLERILNSNSLMTMAMCGGNSCPYNFAEGFMNFANGHFFKGIKCFCTKIKAPALPKEKK